MSGVVELVDLAKYYGENPAVDHIDLRIESGEFFSLLGPSGCGKTTTLRLIAGFERPDSGAILIDGVDQAGTPPHKRPVNTVFQSYALFPHMNVADNVAFGLAYQDVPKAERNGRVAEALDRVHLSGMESRKPTQLSGGQQQRVALARSLVLSPSVLLLDEPLGALDAKLRKSLQVELKRLQEDLEITFIYVTHDQEEAMTMSDRIAVMTEGTVEQTGTPAEIYETPTSSYIADFLGISNLMYAEAVGPGRVALAGSELDCVDKEGASGEVTVSIRPERVQIHPPDFAGDNVLTGEIERVVFAGPLLNVLVTVEEVGTIQVTVPNQGGAFPWDWPDKVALHLPAESLRIVSETGTATVELEADLEAAGADQDE
ncbi:MAG TPA: ABC transporter ATP-binding protein [Acidimicrobiia bacterium]|nr:ABC transporter ATP-binding protein [Acidimicrobiia bacterium]HEU4917688.1 ABC transporter ATP-binding protein [Acidimicrobiia bacterium]